MTITLNFLVLSTSELESKGVSLERIVEYAALPPEAARRREGDDALPPSWPAGGRPCSSLMPSRLPLKQMTCLKPASALSFNSGS